MPTTVSVLAAMLYAAAFSPSTATAQELVLVENGAARARIVLFEGVPPRTREAAEQLTSYIEKVSGARPELVEGTPDPVPEHVIWVGHQPILDELFPDVNFEFEHPEEIVIAAKADHLVIAGRDRWLVRMEQAHFRRRLRQDGQRGAGSPRVTTPWAIL